jgi:uncharacterized membrane protein
MINAVVIASQIFVFVFLPAYLIRLSQKYKVNRLLSDIVICYGIGMVLGNSKAIWLYSWTDEIMMEKINSLSVQGAQVTAFISVLIAIPLLLMVNNVTDWVKYTGKITLVFFLGVFSTVAITLLMGFLFKNSFDDVPIISGMMAGVYIGGTPNMVAISKALHADEHIFLILNATDTICSGLYFFLLMGFGKTLIGLILPAFQSRVNPVVLEAETDDAQHFPFPPKKISWAAIGPLLIATVVAILSIAVSLVPAFLVPDARGELNQALLMLTLTTLGILLSFNQFLRTLHGVFPYAQYLLLIFGLSAGYLTDFSQLATIGGNYLIFNICVIVCIITVHLLLSKIIRADTDSFMLSSTATIMGPPFVAQMASSIKNKELLPAGIALSLLGFGLANYAGILVAWLVAQF